MKSGATVYRSRIDWWLWAVLMFVLTVIIVVGIVVPMVADSVAGHLHRRHDPDGGLRNLVCHR